MYGEQEGERSERNRFFPTLGNHDWGESDGRPNNIEAHKAFFTGLPGNGRYYSFSWGAANFFAVDSDEHEPDGIAPDSVQGRWLQAQLRASTAAFNVVFMHHCPYSSAAHGDQVNLQWPCADASLPCVAFSLETTPRLTLSLSRHRRRVGRRPRACRARPQLREALCRRHHLLRSRPRRERDTV